MQDSGDCESVDDEEERIESMLAESNYADCFVSIEAGVSRNAKKRRNNGSNAAGVARETRTQESRAQREGRPV